MSAIATHGRSRSRRDRQLSAAAVVAMCSVVLVAACVIGAFGLGYLCGILGLL